MEKTTTAIKPGTKFLAAFSGTHTIREVTDDHVLHDYTDDDGRKVTGAFMYRHVFDKYVNIGMIYILPPSDN